MDIPEWLPDWRYPEDYPDPETMTNQQWAWEFLRRNSRYQEIYNGHCRYIYNTGLSVRDLRDLFPWDIEFLSISDRRLLFNLTYDIVRSHILAIEEFGEECNNPRWNWELLDPAIASNSSNFPLVELSQVRAFFLATTENSEIPSVTCSAVPSTLLEGVLAKASQKMFLYLDETSEGEEEIPPLKIEQTATSLTFQIDLKGNIHNQLGDIKVLAEQQKEFLEQEKIISKPARNRIKDYIPYLRVYDADLAGFGTSEIGSILFPEINNEYPNKNRNSTVRNHLKKATQLIRKEYREFVFSKKQ